MFNLKVANQTIFEEKDVSLKFMNKILIHIILGYILIQFFGWPCTTFGSTISIYYNSYLKFKFDFESKFLIMK